MITLDKLERTVRGLVSRAIVNSRAAGSKLYQVLWMDDRVSADVEMLEPQGVHFRAPADAVGALLAPAGNKSASVLLCACGAVPADAQEPGEGGLHYLGTWALFVAADGTLHLGARNPSDWAALASLVDDRINSIVNAFDTHTHPAPGGATSAPTAPMPAQLSVASTVVRMA